jgi:hypothetical protein
LLDLCGTKHFDRRLNLKCCAKFYLRATQLDNDSHFLESVLIEQVGVFNRDLLLRQYIAGGQNRNLSGHSCPRECTRAFCGQLFPKTAVGSSLRTTTQARVALAYCQKTTDYAARHFNLLFATQSEPVQKELFGKLAIKNRHHQKMSAGG